MMFGFEYLLCGVVSFFILINGLKVRREVILSLEREGERTELELHDIAI